MLNLIRPPQHSVDYTAEWIYPADPAWDNDRVEADRKRLSEAAIGNLPATATEAEREAAAFEACQRHPVSVWYSGATRYSLTAKHTIPEVLRTGEHPATAVEIGEYLKGAPTKWVIRSLGALAYRKAMSVDTTIWHVEVARHGLVRIEQPGEEPIEPGRDSTGAITDDWLDWLDSQDRGYISRVAQAVFALSQAKGTGDEGKP